MRKLNVVELYAGIGRCSAPFASWRRASIGLLVDWNPHAQATYRRNRPRTPYIVGDLSSMSVGDLETAAGGKIDIVLGCPPCQGFSESGRRDPDDPRNDHVSNFIRLAVGARPYVIAMENVPMAAMSLQFQRATATLINAGYRWSAAVLNAARYGSAQTRHRLVLVAIRNDVGEEIEIVPPSHSTLGNYFDYRTQAIRKYSAADDDILGTTSSARRAGEILSGTLDEPDELEATPRFQDVVAGLPAIGSHEAVAMGHVMWAHSAAVLKRMRDVPEGGQWNNGRTYYGAAYARLHRKGLARTLTTYFSNAGSGRFWHPTENRALTVREAARLQGIPDSFRFFGGATPANAVLLGNTLDIHLANATYQTLRRALD